jgi:serine/threonine protein kinase
MPLSPGTRLGPYEIIAPLAAGGMGEVYRAKDTRLDRTIAIKVLPEHLSQNPNLRQSLENEARTISKLAHPNICTLHDIGHQDGTDFLVLEFVEGKTLRELLRAGRLPMRTLIPIAVQVAEGLAQAHEASIIHRDLKPENLMVADQNLVKILDFGLAKLALESEEQTDTSITTDSNTEEGGSPGRLGICLRNRRAESHSISGPTNSLTEWCFTRWRRESAHFKRARWRKRSWQLLAESPNRSVR